MADYITKIRTNEGDKQIDYNALANLPASVMDATNTVISPNADYAEVGEWADGNPTGEDRLGYFVAVAQVDDNTIKIRKATSADDVRGVTVYNPAFSGNAAAEKYGEDGELLKQYNYVGVMGIVKIIDNGQCAVNGRCMPGDDGTAIPSTNNMGYAVLERVDATHVLIAVEPNADMIQRVKTDVEDIQEQIGEYKPPLIVTGSPEVKSMAMSGTNFAIYNTSSPLSHTGEEIYNAFNSGRDVYIRLSKDSYGTNLGTSNTLPDIQYVDARVVSVSHTGMNPPYNFVAHGEGFSNNMSTGFYRVYVSDGVTGPQIQAYWYKPTTA